MTAISAAASAETARPLPRLGFVGVGWIGRHRMKAILDSGMAEAAVIADAAPECTEAARELAPHAELAASLDEVLEAGVDGVVIATPSALHAEQSIMALERGAAVFCQKPLGRSEAEVRRVVDAARTADRLLGVDMSYRFSEAARTVRNIVRSGDLGRIFSAELTFHNAYGPDKPWFRDKTQSGGGCVMDLGVHLIDMALWTLDFPEIRNVEAFLYDQGERLAPRTDRIETFASATMEIEDGAIVELACSWNLHAGRDAVISADFHGSEGGASFRNIDGSFYDFVAERYRGTGCETLAAPPDEWGGRAAASWASRLAAGEGFDPSIAELEVVARAMDRIYEG